MSAPTWPPHPTPRPAPGPDGTVPTLGSRPAQRMDIRRAQVEHHGRKLAEAIGVAYDAVCELSYAMPIWSDLTADQHIALGERGAVWSMLEAQHQEILTLARQLRDLRASGAWVRDLHERIPTQWTAMDTQRLLAYPEAWGLTPAHATEIEQDRAEVLARMETTARILAGIVPATTPVPETNRDAV